MSEVPTTTRAPGSPKEELAKALSQRPNREELVQRNILPKTNVAPALVAAQKELERSRLEDTLENKLKARPDAAELLKEGILEYPPMGQTTSTKEGLAKALAHRPDREQLVERNILPNSNVAPALMAAQKDLERSQLGNTLENKLKNRPGPEVLVKEGILNKDEVPGA